jgi:hypothetical protein
VKTIRKFTDEYWQDLIENAREYLIESKGKRNRATSSSSASAGRAEDAEIYDPDGAFEMDVV